MQPQDARRAVVGAGALRADATSRVEWRINDRRIVGNEWSLIPGKHTITAVDASGKRDSVQILVK